MINNDTTLYLLKDVELDADCEHTIDFDNLSQQQQYFNSRVEYALVNTRGNQDFQYIRENQEINVAFNFDDMRNVNYLMYNNNDKWHYCFITNKEYVNPNVTKIKVKIDVYQTFMFDFNVDECFVEREHQDRWNGDGTPIFNRNIEALDKGDGYIIEDIQRIEPQPSNENLIWFCVVAKTDLITDNNNYYFNADSVRAGINGNFGTRINGLGTGTFTYYIPVYLKTDADNTPVTTLFYVRTSQSVYAQYTTALPSAIGTLYEDPNIVSITATRYPPFKYSLYPYENEDAYQYEPTYKVDLTDKSMYMGQGLKLSNSTITAFNVGIINIDYSTISNIYKFNLSLSKDINNLSIDNLKNIDYEPKLKTAEFGYLELNFGADIKQKYLYENFNTTEQTNISILSPLSSYGGGAVIPLDYLTGNMDVALQFNNQFMELPHKTDAWLSWLQSNKNSLISGLATQKISNLANVGLSLLNIKSPLGLAYTGNQILSNKLAIDNKMAQIKDIKSVPDDIEKSSFDIFITLAFNGFYLRAINYSIENSFKNKIFNYLYHYGYKCNDFKTPNLKSRYYFNYIKTIDANIKSNIANDYILELKNIFDKGITIWHYRDASTFKGVRNYNYENVEMALMPAT